MKVVCGCWASTTTIIYFGPLHQWLLVDPDDSMLYISSTSQHVSVRSKHRPSKVSLQSNIIDGCLDINNSLAHYPPVTSLLISTANWFMFILGSTWWRMTKIIVNTHLTCSFDSAFILMKFKCCICPQGAIGFATVATTTKKQQKLESQNEWMMKSYIKISWYTFTLSKLIIISMYLLKFLIKCEVKYFLQNIKCNAFFLHHTLIDQTVHCN